MVPAVPADALVRERLASLCLQLLAASGRELSVAAEGAALERLAALMEQESLQG